MPKKMTTTSPTTKTSSGVSGKTAPIRQSPKANGSDEQVRPEKANADDGDDDDDDDDDGNEGGKEGKGQRGPLQTTPMTALVRSRERERRVWKR